MAEGRCRSAGVCRVVVSGKRADDGAAQRVVQGVGPNDVCWQGISERGSQVVSTFRISRSCRGSFAGGGSDFCQRGGRDREAWYADSKRRRGCLRVAIQGGQDDCRSGGGAGG